MTPPLPNLNADSVNWWNNVGLLLRPANLQGCFHTHPRSTVVSLGAATNIVTKPSPTITMRTPSAIAVPSKRPTDMYDVPGPSSPSPSPSTLPQPKRLHAAPSASRKPPQPSGTEFGGDLDPFIIAHDASAQSLLDANRLAWGTIFEIARGVTKGNWRWSDFTLEKVQRLRGTNAQAAHQVAAILQGCEVFRTPTAEIWCFFFFIALSRRNVFQLLM